MSLELKFTTLIGEDVKVTVEYDYQPSEKMEYEDGLAVYPGCDEEIDNMSVSLGDADITDILSEEIYNQLDQECLNHIHSLQEDIY